jgi:hypothetical protein
MVKQNMQNEIGLGYGALSVKCQVPGHVSVGGAGQTDG